MIEIKIKTDDFVLKSLRKESSELKKAVESAIKKATFLVQATAIKGIQRGQKTGRIYKRGKITHTASAPGEYPASDTGRLAGSIRSEFDRLAGTVGSDLNYAGFLNDGTDRMQARPFLEPSFEAVKEKIELLIDEAIKSAFEI